MKKLFLLVVLVVFFFVYVVFVQVVDVLVVVGVIGQLGMIYCLGLSWDWDKSWWQIFIGCLIGYWDVGYIYWEGGDEGVGKYLLLFVLVFVYEFVGDLIKLFIEVGIGVVVFFGICVGDQNLGFFLNFEDCIGVGLKFVNGQLVGVWVIYYFNVGLKQLNDGIEFYSLFYKILIQLVWVKKVGFILVFLCL